MTTTYRFNCLSPETFLRQQWCGIPLHGNQRAAVPLVIPEADTVSELRDPELLVLYAVTSLVSSWRGVSINGWPRWAIEVSDDEGPWATVHQLRKELTQRIYDRFGIDILH